MARLGIEPMINRSEVDSPNHYLSHTWGGRGVKIRENGPKSFMDAPYVTYIVMRQKVSLGLSEFG